MKIKIMLLSWLMILGAVFLVGCGNASSYTTDSSTDSYTTDSSTDSYGSDSYSTDSSTDSYDSDSYSDNTWTKTAGETDGYDWIGMTDGQKNDIVLGVMQSWLDAGKTIDVDEYYFIDAMDAFYGDEATNSTNLAEALSMTAVAGDVVH